MNPISSTVLDQILLTVGRAVSDSLSPVAREQLQVDLFTIFQKANKTYSEERFRAAFAGKARVSRVCVGPQTVKGQHDV